MSTQTRFTLTIEYSLERCDLGVKTAAFAAFGEIAALRAEDVTDPFGVVVSGVNEGESTLKRFFAFSFWLSLAWSWMYGQAEKVSPRSLAGAVVGTYCFHTDNARRWSHYDRRYSSLLQC
jgi:hypothetical protein